MRLTLRTLLAYLDDVLEPAQAKEIGQKIKESSVATDLVERIRDVMRRRRLNAPEANDTTPQGNANTVAEYLDNILTPDQVTQLERVCLESDVNLAEVAAAHQILSLVLGEPITVPTATKERMYALAGAKTPSDSKATVSTYELPANTAERVASLGGSGVIPKGALAPPEASTTPVAEASDSDFVSLPDEIRPSPVWKRALPWALVSLVLVAWLLTLGNPNLLSRLAGVDESSSPPVIAQTDTPRNDVPNAVADDMPPEEVVTTEEPKTPETPSAEGDQTESTEKPDEIASTTDSDTTETPPKLDGDEETKTPEPPKLTEETPEPTEPEAKPDETEPTEVASNSTTKKPENPPTLEEKTPAESPAETAEIRDATAAEYRSTDGILLYKEQGNNGWKVKPHHAALRDGEFLAVPEPFDALLMMTGPRHSLGLQSRTVIQWIGPKEKADGGFLLKRGQVAFLPRNAANVPKEKESDTPLTVTVTVGLDSWLIQVLTTDTLSGVEVIPYEPQKFEEGVKPDRSIVQLCVAKGSVKYARIDGPIAEDQFRVVDGPITLTLPSKYNEGEAVDDLMSELTGEQLPGGRKIQGGRLTLGYEWLNDHRPAAQRNRSAKQFIKEFELGKDNSIEPLMLQVSKDPTALMAKLATTTLGLVGDYQDLIQVLQKTQHAEVRQEALHELRIWLAEAPENGRLLHDSLMAHFPPVEASTLYELLWGYDTTAGMDPETSALLVNLLASPNDSIRELAFMHIRRLTNNRQNDYRPNSPESIRQTGVNNWKKFLEKNQGTLIPRQKSAEPDATPPDTDKPAL
ncbi:MAG: hypothetical protein KDA68_09955 [Planctomycetaceae bacterium]|nr:hypothetical protein [Planctomycetaceae bacterium]